MVDLSDKGSSESEEMNTQTPDRASSDGSQVKTCADCGTTKTPLWRGGPAGPKSLCNACGIRSRKKRAIVGVNKEEKKAKKSSSSSSSCSNSQNQSSNKKLGESVKRKLLALGREMVLQRPRSRSSTSMAIGKQRRKLGEEEQAAFLLMALSCGSVYA